VKHKVVLHHDEEGYAVSVPALPGCYSQGDTEQEALENIADAIRDFIAARAEMDLELGGRIREVEVPV
jgi:predicted RNase H-like HicB family nuclease